MSEQECPCGSGKSYQACCQPFHLGGVPQTAQELMRSRYTAYAFNLPGYIIQTTHLASPQYSDNQAEWTAEISSFSQTTQFKKLEVLNVQERGDVATITFVAHLIQNNQSATFTEKSFFERLKGKWFYRGGVLAQGHVPNFMTTHEMKLLPIAYYGNPILRAVADPIAEITDDVRMLVQEMIETMDVCDGIGLAAPQVHHSIRLFIIREPIENQKGEVEWGDVKVFINPVVSELSEETWIVSEGCLSIPTIRADVERSKEITIEFTDLDGQRTCKRCKGWEARVILHEYDHINGVLFIDHLSKEEREAIDPLLKRIDRKIHDGTEL